MPGPYSGRVTLSATSAQREKGKSQFKSHSVVVITKQGVCTLVVHLQFPEDKWKDQLIN